VVDLPEGLFEDTRLDVSAFDMDVVEQLCAVRHLVIFVSRCIVFVMLCQLGQARFPRRLLSHSHRDVWRRSSTCLKTLSWKACDATMPTIKW
jgi:hypothetical protein